MFKYRVFNKNTKEFEKWHTIKQDGNPTEFYKGLGIDLFTHKLDRKGNKIYERDIVHHKLTEEIGLIEYSILKAMWVINIGLEEKPLGDFSPEDSLEIIGNYYQNKDLANKIEICEFLVKYIKDNMNYGEKITLKRTAEHLFLDKDDIKELENYIKEWFEIENIKFNSTFEELIDNIYKETKRYLL